MGFADLAWPLLGVAGGCLLALQVPVNAELARGLGHPVGAAMISFTAGAVALALLCGVLVSLGGVALDFGAPPLWTFLLGGVCGAGFITSLVILTPRIGGAAVLAFSVTGQLLGGILLDRIGFLGLAVREVSLGRIVGAALLVTGALLIRIY